jgi:putative peptidoglycan lipid II flippase
VLYAAHEGRRAAVAVVSGWTVAAVGNVALIVTTPNRDVVAALGAGTSVGLSLAGALLLATVARCLGGDALRGLARTGVTGVVAGAAAGAVGYAVGRQFDDTGTGGAVLGAAAVATVAAVVFLAGLAVGDRGLLAALARDRGRIRTAA